MPQYLAPGVYVEEIAGPRSIQGVSTSTAAFVGPCRFGPTSGRPELLTSYLDFVRIYGDSNDLLIGGNDVANYLSLAVKGFFDEGGSSLYVARVFSYTTPAEPKADHAAAQLAEAIAIMARFPGLAGRMQVTMTLRVGNNALVGKGDKPRLTRLRTFDTVYAIQTGPDAEEGVYVVIRDDNGVTQLANKADSKLTIAQADAVYPITVVVEVQAPSVDSQGLPIFGPPVNLGEFSFDPRAAGGGVTSVLAKVPPTRAQALTVPIAIEGIADPAAGAENEQARKVAELLLTADAIKTANPKNATPDSLKLRQKSWVLTKGSDGTVPIADIYAGTQDVFNDYQNAALDVPQRGLKGLESIDDISIVVAPGASSGWNSGNSDLPQGINNVVITHCENMRYRVAALDAPKGLLPNGVLDFRNKHSSNDASIYYPWITIPNPTDGTRLDVPPAGYIAGIWARSDNLYGVIKAPANEVVRSAIDLELRPNKAQQELLNPEGVNCLRFFPGPGFLVWGARTISDDPEWKYLSLRRYFNYLEKSIDQGTQWVVFEVNGPALWDAVRHTVEGFLLNEWKSGALLGLKPEQGYFVKCDASTMTQNDLDNGRLICIIGVAAAKPAEFVIFRISQWTATATA